LARLKKVAANEWAGPCPRCGGTDRFSINVRKGVFNCRRCKVGRTDAIGLLRFVTGSTLAEAKAQLGDAPMVTGGNHRSQCYDPAASVLRISAGMRPVPGSPGERYLKETRGIDTSAVADMLAHADAIGWNPAVFFNQPGHPLHGQRLGAIIGVMSDPVTAEPTGAISRTYIGPDLKKVGPAKTLRSSDAPTGIIRLSRDEDVLGGLHIGEGIETCLAAAAHPVLACRPIWAMGSASTMRAFPVLAGIEALTIVCDHDENGAGQKAAQETAKRWVDADREVRIITPTAIGDLNDIIKPGGGGA
jgi:hypothetical protein